MADPPLWVCATTTQVNNNDILPFFLWVKNISPSKRQKFAKIFKVFTMSDPRARGDYPFILLSREREGPEKGKSQVEADLRKPKWDLIQLQPFDKNIYREHPTTASRSAHDVDDYRRVNRITVKGCGAAKPILGFEEVSFPDYIIDALRDKRNSGSPSCIEAQCWPIVLGGRDFLGVVQAGSRKTLAYVLPAVMHALSVQRPRQYGDHPIVVVLAPSRELVQQIHRMLGDFGQLSGLRSVCVHSGVRKDTQHTELAGGCDVCVAMPGRLLEFIKERRVNLHGCTFLAIDEADRMVTMGLELQVLKIAEQIRPDRQTVMWTGSWPEGMRPFVESLLEEYVQVTFGSAQPRVSRDARQTVYVVNEPEKERMLTELLDDLLKDNGDRAIVLVRTQGAVHELTWKLRQNDWRPVGFRRGMAEEQRQWALSSFHSGSSRVLVSTHGSGRDLAIEDVRSVVNFDFPESLHDYTLCVNHLVSAADGGEVYTFFTPNDRRHADDLVATLRDAKQMVRPSLLKLSKESGARGRRGRRAKR
nr:probable ATP-dependent RNA helicase DDX5 [Dermacentor andersoni]